MTSQLTLKRQTYALPVTSIAETNELTATDVVEKALLLKMNTENNFQMTKEGIKNDKEKLRYDLIPTSAIEGLAQVLTMGAKKYSPNGWKTVPNAVDRYYSALHRHLIAWRNGEMTDPESGLHHMKHVMINAAFLLELTNEKKTSIDCDKHSRTLSDDVRNWRCPMCGGEVHDGPCRPKPGWKRNWARKSPPCSNYDTDHEAEEELRNP